MYTGCFSTTARSIRPSSATRRGCPDGGKRPHPAPASPRCGTSFLFVVIVVSILSSSVAFTYVEWQNLWVRIGMHLLLLVPVVGLTYEFNRFVGRHDNAFTRALSAPGMWLQNFTTFEPDDFMLEVAIEALTLVLPEEKGKDKWVRLLAKNAFFASDCSLLRDNLLAAGEQIPHWQPERYFPPRTCRGENDFNFLRLRTQTLRGFLDSASQNSQNPTESDNKSYYGHHI